MLDGRVNFLSISGSILVSVEDNKGQMPKSQSWPGLFGVTKTLYSGAIRPFLCLEYREVSVGKNVKIIMLNYLVLIILWFSGVNPVIVFRRSQAISGNIAFMQAIELCFNHRPKLLRIAFRDMCLYPVWDYFSGCVTGNSGANQESVFGHWLSWE